MKKSTAERRAVATEISDAQAQQLAEQIIKTQASSSTQIMCSVGKLVFGVVYDGDETLWHSNDPTKGQSLTRLSGQPGMADAQWGRTRLRNAVGLYLLSKALGSFKAYPHLQATHLLVVIGMDRGKQKSLLAQAEAGRWTVAQLEKAAGKRSASTTGHHSAQTEIAHLIKQVTTWEDPKAGLAASLSSAGVPAAALVTLSQTLSELGALASQIDDQLKGRAQQKLHDIAIKDRQDRSEGEAGEAPDTVGAASVSARGSSSPGQ